MTPTPQTPPRPTGATFRFRDGELAVICGFRPVGRGWTVHFYDPRRPELPRESMSWGDFKCVAEELPS